MALKLKSDLQSHVKTFYFLFFIIVGIVAICLSSCSKSDGNTSQSTEALEEYKGGMNISQESDELPEAPLEINFDRVSWNIELTVKEITCDGVVVIIKDLDNEGFYYNPLFYNIEKMIEGEWTAITHHSDPYSSMEDYAFVPPRKNSDYTYTQNLVDFTMLYDKSIIYDENGKLIPGRYRVIQYLNKDKEFSAELEIE